MGIFPNKKLYVTKGEKYIRYRDTTETPLVIDAGYPKNISGNWGDLNP